VEIHQGGGAARVTAVAAVPTQSWRHDGSCGAGNPRRVGWQGLNRVGSGAVRLGRFGAVWLGHLGTY
jgi:hypothetical protein